MGEVREANHKLLNMVEIKSKTIDQVLDNMRIGDSLHIDHCKTGVRIYLKRNYSPIPYIQYIFNRIKYFFSKEKEEV